MKTTDLLKQPAVFSATLRNLLAGFIVIGVWFSYPPCTNAQLSVPLVVHEALPSAVAGLARSAAPVSVGIPLAQDSGISSVDQLGLSGVAAGQFRALAWWPNGNIKWVLADFQTDLSAGQTKNSVSITDGTGNFGGSALAIDSGSTITINTGAAQFAVRKANFNVFDSVVVGSKTLVARGNAGRVSAVGTDGTVYNSSQDGASNAVIEENGPVRAVIKATGGLKSATGGRLMEYTLRLHFYKDSSLVKAFASVRNAGKNNNFAVAFKSCEIMVPLSIGAGKTVTFARKIDEVSRKLTGTANLQQGHSSAFAYPYVDTAYNNWDPPVPGTAAGSTFAYDQKYNGLRISVGNERINEFGLLTDWTQGYARLEDSAGMGVSAAVRWMGGYWPASFEIKDTGAFSVELFGKWSNKNNKLPWGKHESREILWDFHTATAAANVPLYAVQYPVLARADFNYYAATKAMFGQQDFVSAADQSSFFKLLGKTAPSLNNPDVTNLYRAFAWGVGGGDNQTDFPLNDLVDYLRTGSAGWYLRGEQRTLFNVDSAVTRSDDFALEVVAVNSGADPMPGSRGLNGDGMDSTGGGMEHAHLLSLPFYYYLSGNEAVKEAFIDHGERLWRTQQSGKTWFPISRIGTTAPTIYFRAWSRKIRNLALVYEFTKEINAPSVPLMTEVVNATNYLLDSRDDPGQHGIHGRNLDRGYIYWDSSQNATYRVIHSLFNPQIHFEAMYQVLRVIKDTEHPYARQLELEDYLTGQSQFYLEEYLSPSPPDDVNKFSYGYIYDYPLDNDPASTPLRQTKIPYDTSRAAVWGYQHTGKRAYLDKGAQLLWEITSYATKRSPSELQDQALMWSYLNKALIPTWHNMPLTVTDNGGGSYNLSWTVPRDATQYQIKHSDKQIVEWLGFNNISRAFQYDPAHYTAFFAANNIAENPAPAGAGTVQSITLTGLPPGQKFAAKYLPPTSSVPKQTTPASKLRGNWL